MYNVTLEKIVGGHAIRTETVTGFCVNLPEVGKSLVIISEALDSRFNGRMVQTSEVLAVVRNEHRIDFQTRNSIYSLIIDSANPDLTSSE